jgi:FAD/FMN-containing dehydrogenase
VVALRIVDANGDLRKITGDELRLVVGVEGRTGLVVEVTLQLQQLVPMFPLVAVFDAFEKAERCLADVAARPLPIWSVHMMGPIGSAVQSRSWPDLALPGEQHAVVFSFRQADAAGIQGELERSIRESGGRQIEVQGANEEWLVQFASLQAQATTPIPMQFQLPLGRAAEFDAGVRAQLPRLAVEGVVTDAGKAVVLRYFFAERPVSIEDNIRAARDLLALAKRLGGRVYSTGAVFTEEAEAVFGAQRLKDIDAFRHVVDPDGRLNPGLAF